VTVSRFGLVVVAAFAAAGCGSTPEPAPSVASQTQRIQLAPAPQAPLAPARDLAGTYELELLGDGLLAGQHLTLVLRREAGELVAECHAGRWHLSGSVEGGGSSASAGEPLAVALMGLSPDDDAPIAVRLMFEASSPGASSASSSASAMSGTAIVERAGTTKALRFVTKRARVEERRRPRCGELMWSSETRYHGPDHRQDVTTRRFEGCVEVEGDRVDRPAGDGD
jgi:hypothetical protein